MRRRLCFIGAACLASGFALAQYSGPALDQSQITTALDAMASQAPPPPVNSTGATGTDTRYARADHTHVSSVWAGVSATTAAGTATFDFPAGFFAAPPAFSADIVNTDPATLYNRAVTTYTKDRIVVSVRSYTLLGVLSIPASGLQVSLIARRTSSP